MHIKIRHYSHFSGNNLMVLGHGASFSSNTLPSISSVMCGGVLKKCSICTRSQKSNLYAVQLIMLQAPKTQHHCFAHIITCATLEIVSPFIYTTLTYVMKMIYFQVKTSMLTCLFATYVRIQEFLHLKTPTFAITTTSTAQTFSLKKKKKISLTV